MYIDSENVLENKLIILYALKLFKVPLTKDQIAQVIIENIQISYFDIQFLSENLYKDGFIGELAEGNSSLYFITESGESTLELFQNRIPTYIKDIISMYVNQNKDIILRKANRQSSYTKQSDNKYIVNLKLYENKELIFDLDLSVTSKEQAHSICSNWEKKSSLLYENIVHTLINYK